MLALGAVPGALGTFLALPVAATVQAVSGVHLRRHELADSQLLREEGTPVDATEAGTGDEA